MKRKCLICEVEFESIRTTHLCCSKSCTGKNDYIKKKEIYIKNSKKRYENNKEEINSKRIAKNAHKYFKKCKVCNKDFKKKSPSQIYCDLKCQRVAYELRNKENGNYKLWKDNNYKNNKQKIIADTTKYKTNRCRIDKLYNLIHRLRVRTNIAFKSKGFIKNKQSIDFLGCSHDELVAHIEKQFTNEMNWKNRESYQIDHIIPLSSAKSEEELYKLCHYTNLQPLTKEDNLMKSNKY